MFVAAACKDGTTRTYLKQQPKPRFWLLKASLISSKNRLKTSLNVQ
jgi:hypothetical protein